MSDAVESLNFDDNETQQLFSILKTCVNLQSSDSLAYNDVSESGLERYYWQKMITPNSVSGNISTSSYTSDDSICDSILEENGRISLAYENLRTIPRPIAEKFATHTKFLDLSYNHFQNLSFLSFFDGLDTLILDRNYNLDANTLPFLPNLKILWINNCNISNLVDWISRVQAYCPALEHLSIMGNPGIKGPFHHPMMKMMAAAAEEQELLPSSVTTDYREYILHLLPQLVYLDGMRRSAAVQNCINNRGGDSVSNRTASSSSSQKLHNGTNCNHKSSPAHNFRDFFLINKRRKTSKQSYQSSSTN